MNVKTTMDTCKPGTSWTLQVPLTTYKPLSGRDKIFIWDSLLARGAAGKWLGAVWFLCLGKEKTMTFSRWDCRLLSFQSHMWTIAGQLTPWTENQILTSQLFTFIFLSVSSYSRGFSPSPLLPFLTESCEENWVKRGKICSYLTHASLITMIAQSH